MSRTQSANDTLDRIRRGTPGWVAIGDFVDDWGRSDADERQRMTVDEPDPARTADLIRWAALIAAAVDWLATTSKPPISTPAWAMSRRYVLDEPWFLLPGEALRMHQLVDTPAAFTVRNIFGGDRILGRV